MAISYLGMGGLVKRAAVWYTGSTFHSSLFMSFLGILSVLHAVFGVLLITVVLLQQKGVGLGAAFGGSSNIYSTKRGIDKTLYRATIGLSVLFFGTALLGVLLA